MASWVVLGVGAFAVGVAVPVVELELLKLVRRMRGSARKLGDFEALGITFLSLGCGFVCWIELATFDRTAAPVIATSGLIGLGFVRWRRGEL